MTVYRSLGVTPRRPSRPQPEERDDARSESSNAERPPRTDEAPRPSDKA